MTVSSSGAKIKCWILITVIIHMRNNRTVAVPMTDKEQTTPTQECGNCKSELSPRRSWPLCSICDKYFHFKCLQALHQATFRGWTLPEKRKWVCDNCNAQRDNTRGTKRPANSPLSDSDSTAPSQPRRLFSGSDSTMNSGYL